MTQMEFILQEFLALTPEQQSELTRRLLSHVFPDGNADDSAAGLRGLHAWTQSAQPEDWSAFYPAHLKTNGAQP